MPIEVLVWTATASFGAVVAFWNLRASRRDLGKLQVELAGRANGELIIAKGWVRDEMVRFAVQLAWVIVGLAVLATPILSHPLIAGATVPILLISNFLVMFNTVMNARDRRILKDHWLR